MEINGQSSRQFVVVKSWHAILTLLAWLVMTVLQFAAVRAETQQNTRDIEEMKHQYVTKDRFDELKENILRRLQRIEDKLDKALK